MEKLQGCEMDDQPKTMEMDMAFLLLDRYLSSVHFLPSWGPPQFCTWGFHSPEKHEGHVA